MFTLDGPTKMVIRNLLNSNSHVKPSKSRGKGRLARLKAVKGRDVKVQAKRQFWVKLGRSMRRGDEGTLKLTFGDVEICITEPDAALKLYNVKLGQSAFTRAVEKIVQSGVKLELADGVPRFHADPDRAGRLIRVLDGKSERGVIEGGKFKSLA